MSVYAAASKAVWFEDKYLGALIKPNVGVIHTTEGTTLPDYRGGATAPNYTALPAFSRRPRLKFFAHFSDERSSRALVNLAGGVETNTLNALQLELVGTCDPRTHAAWVKQGIKHIYWPEAPAWALRDLAAFIVDMNRRHGIQITGPAPVWTAYPDSYGPDGQRFTGAHWRSFYGWCGHQHVPENVHGDPGAFPWAKVEKLAKEMRVGERPHPQAPRRSPRWDAVWEQADRFQDALPELATARRRTLEQVKTLSAKWSLKH